MIVPRAAQAAAVKAHVSPAGDEARLQVRILLPGVAGVAVGGDPGVIESVDQKGRGSNAFEETKG